MHHYTYNVRLNIDILRGHRRTRKQFLNAVDLQSRTLPAGCNDLVSFFLTQAEACAHKFALATNDTAHNEGFDDAIEAATHATAASELILMLEHQVTEWHGNQTHRYDENAKRLFVEQARLLRLVEKLVKQILAETPAASHANQCLEHLAYAEHLVYFVALQHAREVSYHFGLRECFIGMWALVMRHRAWATSNVAKESDLILAARLLEAARGIAIGAIAKISPELGFPVDTAAELITMARGIAV